MWFMAAKLHAPVERLSLHKLDDTTFLTPVFVCQRVYGGYCLNRMQACKQRSAHIAYICRQRFTLGFLIKFLLSARLGPTGVV